MLAGSPTEDVGVRPGDRIRTVEGRPLSQMGLDEVRALWHTPAGRAWIRQRATAATPAPPTRCLALATWCGLVVAVVEVVHQCVRRFAAGTVLRQNPLAGHRLSESDIISLVVASTRVAGAGG